MRHRLLSGTSLRTLQAGLVWAGVSAASPACALPQGGVVSGGAAHIATRGAVLQIDQSTDRAVIDWQSFDIAPGETARFRQPSASSATLNRIHDQDPSQILGRLTANGTVALVNPNGMVFGQGSKVDVGSLIATTADISNASFMRGGRLAFDRPGHPEASITSAGSITVREAGLAALVAPDVSNSGTIVARTGTVALASGDTATVDLYGDGLVSVAASGDIRRALIAHSGMVSAGGGTIEMTAALGTQVMDSAINLSGIVDATSMIAKGGEIIITGEGAEIALADTARLQADGPKGGGRIKIGGDYLGQGATPHADTVTVASGAQITANGIGQGDGGTVIVWSDEHTRFAGTIEAKGGAKGGNGGFVETSSKEILTATGIVDASAPQGRGGLWLLDPNNITINATADTNVAGNPSFTTTDDNAVVTVNSIQTALNAGTSVSITTGTSGANTQAGNITVSSAINKTAGGDASLTLKAHENIDVNAGISSTSGALDVTLWSDSDNSGSGYIRMTNAAITTNGGDVVMGGGTNPATDEAVGTSATGVDLDNGDISTGAGNISIRGRGEAAGSNNYGVYVHGASVLQTTTGNIALAGTGGNGTASNIGVYVRDAGSAIQATGTGDISVTGTGGVGTGTGNMGVRASGGGTISVVDGTATVTGQGSTTGTDSNFGVYVSGAGSAIQATGTGALAVSGTGGGTTTDNYGVVADTAGAISVVDGTATVQGTGSATGTGWNLGVNVTGASSAIKATGTGAVDVTGTGRGTGGSNTGVLVQSAGTISVVDGTAAVQGTGSATGTSSNLGVQVTGASSAIKATGTGDVSVTGTGGGSGAGTTNIGVDVDTAGAISGAGGAVSVTGTGGAGSGGVHYGVYVTGAGSIIKTTGSGNVSLTGSGSGSGNSNRGVVINISGEVSVANGTATVTGQGSATGVSNNYGVYVTGASSAIKATGTGNVSVTGTGGGSGAGVGNYGIVMDTSGVISGAGGNVSVTGAGGTSSGDWDEGVYVDAAAVSTTGTGNVSVTGTGGGSGNVNRGVVVTNAGAISVINGTATVQGTGSATGTSTNYGVYVTGASSAIKATGTGAVSVTGTGGGSGAGATNYGVNVNNSGAISAVSNAVSVTGTGGSGTGGGHRGIALTSSGAVTSTGAATITMTGTGGSGGANNEDIYSLTGSNVIGGASDTGAITLIGDTMNLANLTVQTSANITARPRTAGTTVGLAGGAGTLNLSSAELDMLNAGDELIIGRNDGTGAITVNAYANWAARAGTGVRFLSDAGVLSINGAQTIGARNLTLTTNADPIIGAGVTGSGMLTLETTSAGTTLGIGAGGTVNYSTAELNQFGSGWSQWRIGSTPLTGTFTIGARSWDDPVSFLSAAAGNIVVTGAQTAGAGSNAAFTFSGPAAVNAPLDLTNATGGTQAITFNDTAVVTADIISGGGDIMFGDTLSLGADISTEGGDITLSDDVTLTATSSIDTDAADIDFDGTLDGAFNLTLNTTGDVDFSDDAGTGTSLGSLAIAGAGDVTFAGELNAAGFTLTGGTGAVLVTGAADITNDIGLATTGTVTFGDDLVYGGELSVDATASDITFNGTLDGAGDLTLTTTGDIIFADAVGALTRLGEVTVDPHHFTAGAFNAASFTLTNGTGIVNFTGTGLNTTGDISIATNDDILGTYTGVNGMLAAGAGDLTATVSFSGLDISGAAANLLAGYIGMPGAATQAMANLISIGGVSHPSLPGNPAYQFAGFVIGTFPPGVIGGGSQNGGSAPPDPVTPPPPAPPQEPQTPPPPVTEVPHSPGVPSVSDPVRVERSSLEMTSMQGMQSVDRLLAPTLQSHPYARLITYSRDLYRLLDCSPGDKSCFGEETP